MSKSDEDTHEHEPRWDVIEKLHNKIDEEIDEAFRVNRMSFIEIDITLLMLHEKLSQQKMELYNMYIKQEVDQKGGATDPKKDDPPPKDLYS